MQESEIIKSVASSGASALSSVVVRTFVEKIFYQEKYDTDNIKRLNALKTAYRESYPDLSLPDTWSLSQDNSPYQMLPEGTNWEQYLSTRMRSRKTTDLTVSVKKALKVISDFLDERRLNIGIIHDIHKGDIEELFFGEMTVWLTDTLNSNVDEKLGEKIEKRRQYLDRVFDSADIFKSRFVHDKSPSRNVIKKINNILKKSLMETQRFTLNKFQDITRETRDLHYDFLRGFSYFSEKLKEVVDLEDPESLQTFKDTGGRYTQLFLLFAEKTSGHDEGDFENFDPIKEFRLLMDDRTKKMDIWADVGKEVVEEIPDIFAAAYNMLVVMKLIKLASTIISAQGTTHLFCNKEGKDYFLFLLEDFGFELNNLMLKLALFNEKYHAYSRAEVLDTKKNPSKEKPIGQYVRFGDIFKSIQEHAENLQSFLRSATEGIEKFDGETPEKSWRKKEELYRTLRERMRKKGASEMAERLEKKSKASQLFRDCVEDEKHEEPEGGEAHDVESQSNHDKLPLQGLGSGVEGAVDGVSAVAIEEVKNNAPEDLPAQGKRSEQVNLPSAGNVSRETEAYKKLVAEQTTFLHEEMVESLERLDRHRNAFFDRMFFRSSMSVESIVKLRQILEYGIHDIPYLDDNSLGLAVFYDKLNDFIEQIQDESATNKYKLKDRIAEEIYCIARDLKVIFDKKKYKHLFSEEAKKNIKLEYALEESSRLLSLKDRSLLDLRDQVSEKSKEISHLKLDMNKKEDEIDKRDKEIEGLKEKQLRFEKLLGEMSKKIEQFDEYMEQNPTPKSRLVDSEEPSSAYAHR